MKILVKKPKYNPVAKDLRTPKYKMRVVASKTAYKRKSKHVKGNNDILV